jgi:hypothetical protein
MTRWGIGLLVLFVVLGLVRTPAAKAANLALATTALVVIGVLARTVH